jgi:CRISPR/Cas system CMR-associated protein Cmr3 (group 5 of RAMP superfamily)
MIQSIVRTIHPLPVPLFGSVKTASLFLCAKSKAVPKMIGWAVPLGVGGFWFVWPAVDDGWKQSMGLKGVVKSV